MLVFKSHPKDDEGNRDNDINYADGMAVACFETGKQCFFGGVFGLCGMIHVEPHFTRWWFTLSACDPGKAQVDSVRLT
jgi:hypothetical protein